MKYIDADRLRAEIKERTLFYAGQANLLADTTTLDGFDEVLSIIDSLQQEKPEVDLEKEIELYFDGWTNSPDYFQAINAEGECVSTDEIIEIARHFYELGKSSK